MNVSKLQEKAKEKNKILLIEKVLLSNCLSKIKESEEKTFISDKKEKGILGVLYSVPVGRYDYLNENNRIYPKKLWENLYKNKTPENTYCLIDHPSDDSDGSAKDIVGIWKNYRLSKEYPIADLYIIDSEYGRLLYNVILAGGKVGISMVGFGEFLPDGKTVNPDTYELERLGDWVLYPSQKVYATYENLNTREKDSTSYIAEKMQTLYEKKKNEMFLSNLNELKDKIESINDLKELEKIREDVETIRYSVQSDFFKENLRKLIEKLDRKIKERLSIYNNNEENNKDKEMESIKEQLNKKLLEKAQNISKRELLKFIENYNKMLKKYEEDRKIKVIFEQLKREYNILEKKYDTLNQRYNDLLQKTYEEENLKQDDISSIYKEYGNFIEIVSEKNKIIERLLTERQVLLEDVQKLFSTVKKVANNKMKERYYFLKDIERLLSYNKKLKKENKKLKEALKVKEKDLLNERRKKEAIKNALKEGVIDGGLVKDNWNYLKSESGYLSSSVMGTTMDPSKKLWDEYLKRRGLSYNALPSSRYEDEIDTQYFNNNGNEDEDMRNNNKKQKNEEAIKKEIKKYYLDKVIQYPSIKRIKEDILNSKTLVEAVRKIDEFLMTVDKNIPKKLKENYILGISSDQGNIVNIEDKEEPEDWLGNRL